MAWLLVPAVLSSRAEEIAHLTQLAAFAVALLATVSLALRLGMSSAWAAAAGLLLAATPVALGMAGTAMPDVPAMALGVAGIERLVAWRDRGGWTRALLAGALLALAPLARAHLLLLVGIGALLVAGDGLFDGSWRARPWVTWLPVAAAPLGTAALLLLTRDPGAATPQVASAIATFSAAGYVPRNVVTFFTHWVLVATFAIGWIALRPARLWDHRWALLVVAGASAALLVAADESWMLPAAPFAGVGAAALLDVVVDAWRRRDGTQLVLGLWLLVPLPIAVYVHLPPKYLLASAPAAALLLARDAASRAPSRRAVTALALVGTAGVALGILILRADAMFAGFGRRAAAELITPHASSGRRVWVTSQWGFQWYAVRAGGTLATFEGPYPMAGDLLLTSERTYQPPEIQLLYRKQFGPRARHLSRLVDARPGGRITNCEASISFYSNTCGYLPWMWSSAPLDAFDLWQIE
jgi:hypothetical protein